VEPARLSPVPNRPLLILRVEDGPPVLLLSDLHLGLGTTSGQSAGPPGASAAEMAVGLCESARAAGASRIVLLGDVKHPIVGTPRPLRPVVFDFFSTLLGDGYPVDIVLGNHDVGLAKYLPKEVEVHGAGGAVVGGVGLFHGHRWPTDKVLASGALVAGHLHPGVRLAPSADSSSGKQRCWLRVEFPEPEAPPKRRRARSALAAREMVVLPAFNPLAGTEALNRGRPKLSRSFLFHRFVGRGRTRAYLLDGTDLGELATAPAGGPPEGRERSPPGR
jgi:hypothetical protein